MQGLCQPCVPLHAHGRDNSAAPANFHPATSPYTARGHTSGRKTATHLTSQQRDLPNITAPAMGTWRAQRAWHLPAEANYRFQPDKWCCKRGLNSRPLPYQGSALPLSYCSAGMPCRGTCQAWRVIRRKADALQGQIDHANWTPAVAWSKTTDMDRDPRSEPARPAHPTRAAMREARLKDALKANMAKRKAQVRARQPGEQGTATAGTIGPQENEG